MQGVFNLPKEGDCFCIGRALPLQITCQGLDSDLRGPFYARVRAVLLVYYWNDVSSTEHDSSIIFMIYDLHGSLKRLIRRESLKSFGDSTMEVVSIGSRGAENSVIAAIQSDTFACITKTRTSQLS